MIASGFGGPVWRQQLRRQFAYQNRQKAQNSPPGAAPTTPAQDAAQAPLPWDSIAQAQVDRAGQDYQYTGAGIDSGETSSGIDFGVKFTRRGVDVNNDGTPDYQEIDPSSLTLDYSNPYSRASLLKKAYDQRSTGEGNSLAARGQLYSGAYQNAQNAAASDFNQSNSALLSQFGKLGVQDSGQRYAAWRALQDAPLNAQAEAFTRHMGDPPPAPPQPQPASVVTAETKKRLAAWAKQHKGQSTLWRWGG